MKILIAEDDMTSHRVLKAVLEKWQFDVIPAENGRQAWDILNGDDSIDCAVLDWMMPELDGLEVIGKIRASEKLKGMYIILLTAKGQASDVVAGLDAGANDYITKPFNKEDLKARIRVGERVVHLQRELKGRIAELEAAINQIKTLKGLIPMCASCKKIRDDSGYWEEVEEYVMKHSEAEFSHGICPECMNKLYPEYFDKTGKKKENS